MKRKFESSIIYRDNIGRESTGFISENTSETAKPINSLKRLVDNFIAEVEAGQDYTESANALFCQIAIVDIAASGRLKHFQKSIISMFGKHDAKTDK